MVLLFGTVWFFCVGVLLLGLDAAIATAPQAPPIATTVVAAIARNIRFVLRNRFPLSREILRSDIQPEPSKESLRAR